MTRQYGHIIAGALVPHVEGARGDDGKHDAAFGQARWAPFSASAEALTEAVEAAVAQDMAEAIPEELRARGMRAGALPEQGGRAAAQNAKSQRQQEELTARILEAVKGGDTVKTKLVATALGVTSSKVCDAMVRLCALGIAERVEAQSKNGAIFRLTGSRFVPTWVQA